MDAGDKATWMYSCRPRDIDSNLDDKTLIIEEVLEEFFEERGLFI